MDTWTRQPGFPMVSAVRNGTTLTLKQNRFLLDSKAEYSPESSPAHGYKWEIPITYITSNNNTVHTCWLTKDQDLGKNYLQLNSEINRIITRVFIQKLR